MDRGLRPTSENKAARPLYTPEERARRDASPWTIVQGILAPVQFLIFGVSLYFVLDYLRTGQNYDIAIWSVVVKTIALYTIMITGSIWEKVVFGRYLFAPSFYLGGRVLDARHRAAHRLSGARCSAIWLTSQQLMWLALAAYFTYVINAGQFIWKLRMARLEAPPKADGGAVAA